MRAAKKDIASVKRHQRAVVSKKEAKGGQRVMVPVPADILLGRGKPFQSHQGNLFMLDIVDQQRARYLQADRKGKHVIIEEVLSAIKQRGGRFIMLVENYWVEVKRSISYRKVGHAFRSKARRTDEEEDQHQDQQLQRKNKVPLSSVSRKVKCW